MLEVPHLGQLSAGWKVDPASRHQWRYWDGDQWTSIVADSGVQSLDPLQAASELAGQTNFPGIPGPADLPPIYQQTIDPRPVYQQALYRPRREDPGFPHLLRFLLVGVMVYLSSVVLVGLVWFVFILGWTGRRKRDALMMLIPLWSLILLVQTIWRYSARNVYWSVRADMESKTLF